MFHVQVDVVHLVHTLIKYACQILNEVSALQKLRKLEVDLEGLQQEHHVFNVQYFRQLLLPALDFAQFVVNFDFELEEVGVICSEGCQPLCFSFQSFFFGFIMQSQQYLVSLAVVI